MVVLCVDRYNRIIHITRKVAAVCGADVFRPDYKLNFITWFVIFAINGYFICTIYTIYDGFVVNGDWRIILQTLSLAGSAIQGYCKLLFGIHQRLTLQSLDNKLSSIYKEYQDDKDFLTILTYRTDLTAKILKLVLGIYVILGSIVVSYPLIYGALHDEKLLVMQFFLPGIDPASYSGYLIHNGVHLTLMFMGAFGNFSGDMLIFIFITHVPLLKDILKVKCMKLNKLILRTKDPKETMPLVRDIVILHQNYNAFTQEVEEAYYGVIFVQIFTSVMGITFSLFCMITRTWPAAFAYIIYSFFMLYAYCGLGHLVEVANDDVIDLIYGDIPWYELSITEQKLVLLMLRKSQAAMTLTIGQIMPLSMSTALQLTKAIYSYMMMLVNFLETDGI